MTAAGKLPSFCNWSPLLTLYSIPTRRELVKEAARNPTTAELKESQQEQQEYYWTTDPLSRQPLARPIVSDCNGKLYNKDSIIQHVLSSDGETNKAEAESILLGAVKSIKDVVDVKFEVVSDDSSNGTAKSERFVCPITKDTLGPGMKSVYLVPCGHAFSAAAIKEISEEKCAVVRLSYSYLSWNRFANFFYSALSHMLPTTLYQYYLPQPPMLRVFR